MKPCPILEPMTEADKELQGEILAFACRVGNRGFDRKAIAKGFRIVSEFLTFAESIEDSQ